MNSTTTAAADLPPGFEPLPPRSGALIALGGFYGRRSAGGFEIALRVAPTHTNSGGTLHGGVLATLCDVGVGYAIAFAADPPLQGTTTSLCIDFVNTAAVGDWLVVVIDATVRRGRHVIATARVLCGNRAIAVVRATFSFKNLENN